MIIVNPGGRLVEIDDNDAQRWLAEPDFRKATDDEVEAFRQDRLRWAELQHNDNPDRGSIYFSSLNARGKKDGYGQSSDNIIRELRDLEIPVDDINKGQKIGMLYHSPYSIMRLDNDFKILYTMFESDKIPDDWKDYLVMADKILVPSKWCQKVFKDAGFETEVVNLGYNHHIYKYQTRPPRDVFTFLHYDAFNMRKGFAEVFEAFTKAFDKDMKVKLILKTTLDFLPLPIPPSEYPNIEVRQGKFSEEEMAELCNEADAFVFPSRGEGFGITPLEAMATGLPAIVPNAHGISEYFNDEFMLEVKVKEMTPALYSRYKGQNVGKMVLCDTDDLVKQMQWCVKHPADARSLGKKASEYVKGWTYRQTAEQLKVIFDDMMSLPVERKKINNILPLEII